MVEKTKILITGSNGMLGKSLVDVLSSDFQVKGIDIEDCDITNKDKLTVLMHNYRPYVIIHTAAWTDVDGGELNPEKAFAVNAVGTENVASAAKECGAILFYMSTDYVFDGKKNSPYIETDTPNPLNIYGRSKLQGEKIIQTLLDNYFIIRSSWMFGRSGKNFVSAILQKAQGNEPLEVVDDQIGSPTYTLDLARVIKSLLSTCYSLLSNNNGIYHITNSGSCSWYEFAREIISVKQLKTKILPISTAQRSSTAKRPKMSVLDNSKLMNTFKLNLRPWQEALNHFLCN